MSEPMRISQDQLREEIKRAIISSLFNHCIPKSDTDGLILLLWKISQRRQKFFDNLAKWGMRQIDKGYTQEKVVESLIFFGPILVQYIDKNINHPFKK